MLAIQPPTTPTPTPARKTIPSLLPCSIKHNGPVNASKRYWSPQPDLDDENRSTAYFRGRKLKSRKVDLPEGYRGVVLQKTDKILEAKKKEAAFDGATMAEKLRRMEEGDDEEGVEGEDAGLEEEMEVKVMEERAQFDHVLVWGHESVPAADDVFVRGVSEWIGFAEAMHSYEGNSSAAKG